MANFGRSFTGRRVDELAWALNSLEYRVSTKMTWKDVLCFFPPLPLPLT